jgi:hypothetical protein
MTPFPPVTSRRMVEADGITRICDEQVHGPPKTYFPDFYPKKEQSFLSRVRSRPNVNVPAEFQHPRGFLNQIASGASNRTVRHDDDDDGLQVGGRTVEPR